MYKFSATARFKVDQDFPALSQQWCSGIEEISIYTVMQLLILESRLNGCIFNPTLITFLLFGIKHLF